MSTSPTGADTGSAPRRAPRFVQVVGGPADSLAHKLAWDMSVAGSSVESIQDAIEAEVGSRPTASQIGSWNASARRRAKTTLAESAREHMLRDLHSIESLVDAWLKPAHTDALALNSLVKLLERKSRMLGYDAPTKSEITHDIDPPTILIQDAPDPVGMNEARGLIEAPPADVGVVE